MRLKTLLSGVLAVMGSAAAAQDGIDGLEIIGAPQPSLLGFQPAVTELMRDIVWLDNFLLIIITVISIFVTILLAVCVVKYNRRSNPSPATFTHNSPLEVAWTLLPVLILVVIGSFSLPILFKQQIIPEGDIVIKATGNQWYWTYEYVDEGLEFDSFMLGETALEEYGYSRDEFLLATDTAIVIPSGKDVVVQVTAADVIHSWAIPSFGVKQDGVPGRLAELWFNVDKGREGIYFGQCSELCGKDHAYMPITVKVVTEEQYAAWLAGPAQEFAINPVAPSVQVASN